MKEFAPSKIPSRLLKWFAGNRRPLPWRETNDPYRIWISEIMLQQTQVKTVISYYHRWMKSFPNFRKLAGASLSQVLKSWEGLGYYSRARNLHRAAKIVVKKWRGKLPDSRDELQKLPGVGRYTAGAIASIAFGKPEPILDGNVTRVLARLFALRVAVDRTAGQKKLWEISKKLVGESSKPGDFNQSLMELGALVCLPEEPRCFACPLEKICRAHRLKREMEFPVKTRKERTERLKTVAAVIWKNGRVLLERQPLHGRWGGLWLFPQWTIDHGKSETEFLEKKVRRTLGVQVEGFRPKTEIKHGFTKYRVRLRAYEGSVGAGFKPAPTSKWTWIKPDRLPLFPLPRPHRKIALSIQHHA